MKNVPQYEVNNNDDIIVEFVDSYLTCQNSNSPEMADLINLQMHRHAKTCKRKVQNICRFNFPLPPIPRTMIVEPLKQDSLEENQIEIIKEHSHKINRSLEEMKYVRISRLRSSFTI